MAIKKTHKILLIGVVFVLSLLVLSNIFGTSPAQEASENSAKFLNFISNRRLDSAYALTTTGYQKEIPRDKFSEFVDSHQVFSDYDEVNFTKKELVGNIARITGEITNTRGVKTPVTLDLIKENGEWKVEKVTIMDSTGSP